jgi:hypothetical protein
MRHVLKILPVYYEQVIEGNKTFEVRKNDRNFQLGDVVELREWAISEDDHSDGNFTGRSVTVEITYILNDPNYCKEGFVVFSFKILREE